MMRPRCVEMGNVKATRDTCCRRGPGGAGSVGAGGGWTGTAAPLNTLHTTAPQELATISRTFHNFWKSLLTFLKYLLVLSHLRIYYTTLKESLNIVSPLSSFWLTICYWLLRNMSSPNCGNFCKILSTTLCSSQLGKGLLLLPLGYAAPDHNRQKGNRL